MRPVNLLPPELRPRVPGEGDPRLAYGVLAGLAVLLLMVVVSISYSNKAKTLNDEAAAIRAEADRRQAAVAAVPTKVDDVSDMVRTRTLLVGGLSATRFPWNVAMTDLSKSLPPDVTLDTISAVSASAAGGEGGATSTTMQPLMTLSGCASGWVGYSRLLTWLRQMPGVSNVKSNSSSVGAPAQSSQGEGAESSAGDTRLENCGPAPLNFTLNVVYRPKTADLLGLPKPTTTTSGPGGASGATGAATPATGTPAAAGTGG